MNNAGGDARIAALPPGVTAQRGQISYQDLGDKIAIFDANGQFIGYRVKGLAGKSNIKGKNIIIQPPVSGEQLKSGKSSPIKVEQIPVTNKQLASEINSQIRPMVEARRTGQLALDLIDSDKDRIIPISGTVSQIKSWLSDTDQGVLKSYVENLKSPNVLGAMMALKEASSTGSTGFGQLNIKELDILINRLGALNVNETNVKVLRRSIVSINNSFDSVVNMVKKNVPEEKLKEIGLHKLFYGESDSKKLKKNPNVSAAPPEITTDAQYKALPSGTKYIGPDGKERTKL